MNEMPSLRELYRIGYGPSSSHTIGPGRACTLFKEKNKEADFFRVQLCGSLSKTGKGHRTDEAIQKSFFPIKCSVDFCDSEQDLEHPNTMKLYAYRNGVQVDCCTVLSVGGGEIKSRDLRIPEVRRPYELTTFSQLAEYCQSRQIRIWQYVEQAEGQEIWECGIP